MMESEQISSFLHPGTIARASSLCILHLRRDNLRPVSLLDSTNLDTGYAEGAVENTRFGSYPHSTIIGQRWGSQIGASKVDTGSRGRQASQKRKLGKLPDAAAPTIIANKRFKADVESAAAKIASDALDAPNEEPAQGRSAKAAVKAQTGFCHIVPPTPETWTSSLPHRTQVVYTPDYSFILQKLRVRPGSVVIEAGAGSGSFTHAAARAVFNGYHIPVDKRGKVYSYEYHEPRAEKLRQEIVQHGLEAIVTVTHRDVCADGFIIAAPDSADGHTPSASQIFLDLPAPWDVLRHLKRHRARGQPTPLDVDSPIYLCCFLPCIEQVTKLVSELRAHSWIEIEMLELAHRRLDTRRERVGLHLEGLRGVNATAATVEESIAKLKEIEERGREFREEDARNGDRKAKDKNRESKQERLARIAREEKETRKVFKEGRLVVRTEPEIKTHTSYLVFAVLPMNWESEE